MGLAPILQIRRMLRQRSSREVSLGYFAILLAGFGLWIGYGAAAGNVWLVVPNGIALLTGLVLVAVALRLRRSSPGRRGSGRAGATRPGRAICRDRLGLGEQSGHNGRGRSAQH
jgi:uncharacterized protein with PQ loop repeat